MNRRQYEIINQPRREIMFSIDQSVATQFKLDHSDRLYIRDEGIEEYAIKVSGFYTVAELENAIELLKEVNNIVPIK